jgi:hypothetical protein
MTMLARISQLSHIAIGCLSLLIALLPFRMSLAEILYETGTLRGFLGGVCQDCAYDNWISHISEGIALEGLNDYGPLELDPQTNGFGNFQLIEHTPAGDSLLDNWYSLFSRLLASDTAGAEATLAASGLDSVYQLAVFTDSSRQYYVLREILNLDYYDDQLTPEDSTDDVHGSFDLGWGVYVFSPAATMPEVLIEMPHPCDDFISTFLGIEVFEMFDAGLLMINGAGREVRWNEQGEYNNNKSLSDPTRNDQTVFHAAHRAFVDYHDTHFTVQVHSFDTILHQGMKSVAISAGPDDNFPNEPLLDRCAYDDMISLTPYIPVPANTCGNHEDLLINQYYELFYEGGYAYQGEGPVITINDQLPGYSGNRQILYSHQEHHRFLVPENFVHIEMDEMPDAIEDTITVFYRTDLPGVATFDNFSNAILYYLPAYEALLLAMAEPPMSQVITVTPSPAAFPGVVVGESDTLLVYFQNTSDSLQFQVQDAFTNNQIFEVVSIPAEITLYPGDQCSVTVAFNPQAVYFYHNRLTLSTTEGCSYVEITGNGLGGMASIFPPVANFGAIPPDQTDTTSVLLRNAGNYLMHLLVLVDCPPHFHFLAPHDSLIDPGASLPLEIVFVPNGEGLFQGTLYVVTDAVIGDTIELYARGEGGFLPAAPAELSITKEDQDYHLTWRPVETTVYGSPIDVDGYSVYYTTTLADSFRYLDWTPEPDFFTRPEDPYTQKLFYQVRAVVEEETTRQ